jgi:HTH-type transcriptional regulator/antitoxin HipB
MIYPIKTLNQLPLILKGFRKEKSLTQAAMAEKLGITQQSYAYFEANPAAATIERLFMVLRMLDVGISLDKTSPAASMGATPSVKAASQPPEGKAMVQKIRKEAPAIAIGKAEPSAVAKVGRIVAPTRTKESW